MSSPGPPPRVVWIVSVKTPLLSSTLTVSLPRPASTEISLILARANLNYAE